MFESAIAKSVDYFYHTIPSKTEVEWAITSVKMTYVAFRVKYWDLTLLTN